MHLFLWATHAMSTTLTVQQVLNALDDFAPFSLAADWDNVGLQIGKPTSTVSGICLALDPSCDLLKESCRLGLNTIVTHHPLLFHPLKQLRTDYPLGRMIHQAMINDLTIIACHTNLDVVPHGVSAVLAEVLGLVNCQPLQQMASDPSCGFGRIGKLPTPISGAEFIDQAAQALDQPNISVAGDIPLTVQQVAVCGGSCGELAELANQQGAQIFVSAEIKHSQARWAEDAGICLLDAGHFNTEQVIIPPLANRLESLFGKEVPIKTSQRQQRPLQCLTL